MRRREFIAPLGGAAVAWPLLRSAAGERMRRIGVLMAGLARSGRAGTHRRVPARAGDIGLD